MRLAEEAGAKLSDPRSRVLSVRILHTSDWHIGRTFHGWSTLDALRVVFDAMIAAVRDNHVDVVVVAGDVFDSSTPSAEAVTMLDEVLLGLRKAGARVVASSGNHDSAARLGAKAAFAAAAGVFVQTKPQQIAEPVTITDDHGPVHFYAIPFLDPAKMRTEWPDAEPMRSQADALRHAMHLVRADAAARDGRSVVLAHTFVQGAEDAVYDSQRDILGGLDKVSVPTFRGVDYAALGHIHGRMTLDKQVRYAGAPLHYSFSEAGKPRGGWLVDLDAHGFAGAQWLDLPVPRPLAELRGTLDDLLSNPGYDSLHDHWISAVLTDNEHPMDAMRKLQARFPHCALLRHEPAQISADDGVIYTELVRGKTDLELIGAFLTRVRNGIASDATEADLLRETISGYENQSLRG